MNNIPPRPWAAWKIPNDDLKRYAVLCVNDQHCPGPGKQIVAMDIRTKATAELMAASHEMYMELQKAMPFLVCALSDKRHFPGTVQERIDAIKAIIDRVEAP